MTAARPSRVVMAGPLPPAIGGMASVVRDLAQSGLRDQYDLQLFDTGKQTRVGRPLIAGVSARLKMLWRWWRLLSSPETTVAHIHTCSGLTYFLDGMLLAIARIRRVPAVLHIHGGSFDAFLDRLPAPQGWVARAIARGAARVIVLSDSWRTRLAPRLPGAELRVIENAVPAAANGRVPAEPPILLFVGALCRAKGVEDLIRASAKLSAPARTVLVGPEGEPGFAEHLASLARQLGVDGRTQLPGPADPSVVADWLTRAAVFVLPSYVEGMPIVLLEAMAAELPVVATSVGAVPSVVEAGRSGFLLEPGDVDGLAAALDTLLTRPDLRQSFGRAGRAIWSHRFSIDRAVREWGSLYSELWAPGAAA